MEYIIIENGIISAHCCGETLPEGATEVKDFYGIVGEPASYYNDKWERKTDEELIVEGLIPLPDGCKIDGGKLVPMTIEERVEAGIEEIPEGFKLENGEFVPMSRVEKIEAGIEEIPRGYKIESGELVAMSLIEKIESGIEEIPKGYKIINDEIVEMTGEEKLESGVISQQEYNEIQRQKIISELNVIDQKTTRPLRAILSGLGTDDDKSILQELEKQAQEKRIQLGAYNGE